MAEASVHVADSPDDGARTGGGDGIPFLNGKAFTGEFLGTFALVFIGGGAGAMAGYAAENLTGVALAHALVLFVSCSVFGDISGSHINPAVSLGLAILRLIHWKVMLLYWLAQFLGSMLAGLLLLALVGHVSPGLGTTQLGAGTSPVQGFFIELLLTFFLETTILHTVVEHRLGDLATLSIGMTLGMSILMGGPLTGAALNPVRFFGPALASGTWGAGYIYFLGPLLGASLAAGVYYLLRVFKK